MTKPKSGRFHWLKWWPSRWFADTGLRACSLAARGAWHEILLRMHEEDTGGYLLIGGEVPSHEDVARILSCSEKEWRACEAELERRKVFSRRASDGAIYCRSRVREGVAEGSPVGHPRGLPPDQFGIPPSRALSSSRPLSSLEGSPEGDQSRPTDRPDIRAAHLSMHPTLDTPAVRSALDQWEGHLRERGKAPYTSRNWEANLTKWERWGPARLVLAIQATLCTPACTIFEPEHGERATQPVVNGKSSETPEQIDLRDRWWTLWSRRVRDGKAKGIPDWPGYDQARRELDERAAS